MPTLFLRLISRLIFENVEQNSLTRQDNEQPPIVFEDNNEAKKLTENPEFHKRSKHIDITYYFNRKVISNNQATLYEINFAENIADLLTKPIEKTTLNQLLTKANIINV